jgi:hypothetical protein
MSKTSKSCEKQNLRSIVGHGDDDRRVGHGPDVDGPVACKAFGNLK